MLPVLDLIARTQTSVGSFVSNAAPDSSRIDRAATGRSSGTESADAQIPLPKQQRPLPEAVAACKMTA